MRQGPLQSSELICKMGELVLSYNAVAVVCSFTNNNRVIVTIIMMRYRDHYYDDYFQGLHYPRDSLKILSVKCCI